VAPTITVVTPVFNRTKELRRALATLIAQTFADWECIVVDDASVDVPDATVAAFRDSRLRVIRREQNGGCTAARTSGFAEARGTYVATLDSDNELFPWALERAVALLDGEPGVACASGLYVFPDGLRMRITGGRRVVGPSDYRATALKNGSDCFGVVRRRVVDSWLERRRDFFNLDFHLWFWMSLHGQQLYVDEPWGIYNTDAADRLTTPLSAGPDPRSFVDVAKFVAEYRPLVGQEQCAPLDHFLQGCWFRLRRNRREAELGPLVEWMRERGISEWSALREGVKGRLQERLGVRRAACL
jgi:glycosyltransferase involved in cell wall biosynthesis